MKMIKIIFLIFLLFKPWQVDASWFSSIFKELHSMSLPSLISHNSKGLLLGGVGLGILISYLSYKKEYFKGPFSIRVGSSDCFLIKELDENVLYSSDYIIQTILNSKALVKTYLPFDTYKRIELRIEASEKIASLADLIIRSVKKTFPNHIYADDILYHNPTTVTCTFITQ